MIGRQALVHLATRVGAGQGLWSLAAFLFPTLALVRDESVALAMLLFSSETLIASGLLLARLWIARRHAEEQDARRRLTEVHRLLVVLVLPFTAVCIVMVAAVTLIEHGNRGGLDGVGTLFVERGRWMALMLVAAATLDTLIAPVRSVHWLEIGASWQWSRTAVFFLTVLLGWPVMLYTGTTQGFFWIFFGFRLLSDLGTLMPGERERIRKTTFGEPFTPAMS